MYAYEMTTPVYTTLPPITPSIEQLTISEQDISKKHRSKNKLLGSGIVEFGRNDANDAVRNAERLIVVLGVSNHLNHINHGKFTTNSVQMYSSLQTSTNHKKYSEETDKLITIQNINILTVAQ